MPSTNGLSLPPNAMGTFFHDHDDEKPADAATRLFRDGQAAIERARAQGPKVLGDPESRTRPKQYFDFDPDMPMRERRERLEMIRADGLCLLSQPRKDANRAEFDAVEALILEKARVAARTCGHMYRKVSKDRTGREITTYEGDPSSWMADAMGPVAVFRFPFQRAGTHREEHTVRDGMKLVEVPIESASDGDVK